MPKKKKRFFQVSYMPNKLNMFAHTTVDNLSERYFSTISYDFIWFIEAEYFSKAKNLFEVFIVKYTKHYMLRFK